MASFPSRLSRSLERAGDRWVLGSGLLLAVWSVLRTFVVLPLDPFAVGSPVLRWSVLGIVGLLVLLLRALHSPLERVSDRMRAERSLFLAGILVVAALALVQDSLVHDAGLLDLPGLRRDGELILWAVTAILLFRTVRVDPGGRSATDAETVLLVAFLAVVVLVGWHRWVAGEGLGRAATVALPLLALHRLRHLGHRQVTRIALSVLVPLLAISLVLAVGEMRIVSVGQHRMIPGLDDFRPRGVFSWPIHLGTAAGLTIVTALQGLQRRSLHPVAAGISIVVGAVSIVLADAMSAALAVVLAVLVVGLVRAFASPATALVRGPAMAAMTAVGALTMLSFPFSIARFGGPGSLTGRGHLWQRIREEVSPREFLLGFGDRPLMNDPLLFDHLDTTWGARHAHNAGLELWLTGGALGAALFAALVGVMIAVGLRRMAATRGWSLALITFVLVVWSTENYIAWLTWTDRLLLLLTFALLASWGVDHDEAAGTPPVAQDGVRSD